MASKTSSQRGGYCELHTHSYYSLLDGVPSPEALLDRAAELGLTALALTDHDATYGLASFYVHAKAIGLKPILGAEVTLEDGSHLTLLAETNTGYANLSRLVTASRAKTGAPKLLWNELKQHTSGLICLTGCRRGPVARSVAANDTSAAQSWLSYLINLFGHNNLYVELQRNLSRDDMKISRRLAALAIERGLPYVATGNVHYLAPEEAELQNALVSIRERVPLPKAVGLLRPEGEYFMRSKRRIGEFFADLPEALTNSLVIAERCEVELPTGTALLPKFAVPEGQSADDYLRELCLPQLGRYYANNREEAKVRLEAELDSIYEQGLANYFLIASDMAAFCERQGILYLAQGSATNTIMARLLGLGSGQASAEHSFAAPYPGTPDIELEIEATRREAAIRYVQERWGSAHVALAGKFLTVRSTMAIREAGFALGFNPEAINALATTLAGELLPEESTEAELPDLPVARLAEYQPSDATQLTAHERKRLLNLASQLQGRPWALTVNAESLIITRAPVAQLMAVEPTRIVGQTVTQFNQAGLDALGVVNFGLHSNRMLAAMAEMLALVRKAERPLLIDLQRLDLNEQAVYDLIASARTVGVLWESTGQPVSLLPHFRSQGYVDLVVEASLILQPSLLRSGMVQHYLRRRQGLEPIIYILPLLQPILEETLGVLVFLEQALQIAHDIAGFTPEQIELLRRALNQKNATEALLPFQAEFIEGSLCNDLPYETAEQIWNMLVVFANCALSKARGTALATLVYWSAWLRFNYPAEYFCALLGQVVTGSHPASVLAAEALRANVKLLPSDINRSQTRPSLERNAIRMGLQHMNGIDAPTAEIILRARADEPFRSIAELIQRTPLERRVMEWLILEGALDSLGDRPHLLWELAEAFHVTHRKIQPQPLEQEELDGNLDDLIDDPALFMRFAATSRTARMRLTELRRDAFTKAGCLVWQQLRKTRVGAKVKVGGLVVENAQRPAAARGAAFLRIDEPEGSIQVTIPEAVYLEDREALRSAFLIIEGTLQSQGASVGVVARKVRALA
jgi:error-prone DNA polymerase